MVVRGQAEDTFELPDNTINVAEHDIVHTVGLARKLSYQHACENCFYKLVLVVLPNGKVSVHKKSDN